VAERYLIDTHCWLWWNATPDRLAPEAFEVVANGANTIYFSAASAWEMSIKSALGKLRLPETIEQYLPRRLESNNMLVLPIELRHTLAVAALPPLHRDPFDRLLVAQAQTESLTLITADAGIRQYGVACV
jgi:PIN domain nuclease of toxin-antitoxin system